MGRPKSRVHALWSNRGVKEVKKPKFNNYPIKECEEAARKLIAQGATIYQKFTCAGCGQRLTMDEPNQFFTEGGCDKCDAITDIEKDGCNYLVTSTGTIDEVSAALSPLFERGKKK